MILPNRKRIKELRQIRGGKITHSDDVHPNELRAILDALDRRTALLERAWYYVDKGHSEFAEQIAAELEQDNDD